MISLARKVWPIYIFTVGRTLLLAVSPLVVGAAFAAAASSNIVTAMGWAAAALAVEAMMASLKIMEDYVQTSVWRAEQLRESEVGPGGPDAITRANWLTSRLDLVAWKLPEVIAAAGTLLVAPVLLVMQYGWPSLLLLVAWMLPAVVVFATRRIFEGWYLEAAVNGEDFHRCLSEKKGVEEVLARRVRLWFKRFRTEESTKHALTWWAILCGVLATALCPAGAASFTVAASRIAGNSANVFENWIEYIRVRGQEARRNGK